MTYLITSAVASSCILGLLYLVVYKDILYRPGASGDGLGGTIELYFLLFIFVIAWVNTVIAAVILASNGNSTPLWVVGIVTVSAILFVLFKSSGIA
jgi:hypothetical protein